MHFYFSFLVINVIRINDYGLKVSVRHKIKWAIADSRKNPKKMITVSSKGRIWMQNNDVGFRIVLNMLGAKLICDYIIRNNVESGHFVYAYLSMKWSSSRIIDTKFVL